MVTACLGSRCRAATPAMVAAIAAWSVSSVMACPPVPAWQPGGEERRDVAETVVDGVAGYGKHQHERGPDDGSAPEGQHTIRPYR